MLIADLIDVTAHLESEEFIVRGFSNGTISVASTPKISFETRVHNFPVTSIAIIEEDVRFIRLASADRTGNLTVFNIAWQAGIGSYTVDFEYCFCQNICQMANCYPKHACICLVSTIGTLLSVNWRTGEIRQARLFMKQINDCDFGLLFNRRSDTIYVSLQTKLRMTLFFVDYLSMSLASICNADKLPYALSKPWTRMAWYCDRFILCYSRNYLVLFDPVARCTLRVFEMPLNDEILFLTTKYADVSLIVKSLSDIKIRRLSGKELLFLAVPEPVAIVIPQVFENENKNYEENQVENDARGIQIIGDEAATSSARNKSDVSSRVETASTAIISTSEGSFPHFIDGADCFPKLTEWVERIPEPVPPLMLGQFASDSNISAIQSTLMSSFQEREHASSTSHPPNPVEFTESVSARRDSGAEKTSIRPAISADDRLMKLFFPDEYNLDCPFPSHPAAPSDEIVSSEEGSRLNKSLPENRSEDIAKVNFLDFWPIWLDMPLVWTESLTSFGTGAALFGTIRPSSVSMSKHHIYVTDSANRLSYASLDCKSVRWQIAVDASPADQVSSSPQGDIIWLLRSGSVFAAQNPSAASPVGSRWERILLDVFYIHVAEKRAFYIRRDGALMMQNGLSSRRACYVSIQLHSPFRLKSVIVAGLDLWGQCADGRIVCCNRLLANSASATARSTSQISRRDSGEAYAGEWQVDKHCPPDASRVTAIFAGPFNTVMVTDELCRIWVRRTTTSPSFCLADYLFPASKPKCPDEWWLMPLPRNNDAFGENANFQKTWPLYAAACLDTIAITAPSMGSGALQLYLNKGHLLGQKLRRVRPTGSALTTKWRSVHFVEPHPFHEGYCEDEQQQYRQQQGQSGMLRKTCVGFAWLCSETGELLRLDFSTLNAISPSPSALRSNMVKMVSVGQHVTWILLNDGNVWACHHDLEVDRWAQLDLAQLSDDNLPIVDVAVGPRLVWILSANGTLFFRIGVSIFSSSNCVSQPALCRLTDDAFSGQPDIPLRRIFASPSCDWMIFALPAFGKKNPKPGVRAKSQQEVHYLAPLARMGVTADVPIGALWHSVIGGPPMADLSLSASAGVFGIPDLTQIADSKGTSSSAQSALISTVFWRAGVRQNDPTGTYWRKVVDGISQVSAGDKYPQLCLIGSDGSLYIHAVCCIANGVGQQDDSKATRHHSVTDQPSEKELTDWEVI